MLEVLQASDMLVVVTKAIPKSSKGFAGPKKRALKDSVDQIGMRTR